MELDPFERPTGEVFLRDNFLILKSLKQNYPESKRCQEIYHKLRRNIIENIKRVFEETDNLFGAYSSENGQGI